MKNFIPGFVIFLLYTVVCLLFLGHFFFDTVEVNEVIPTTVSNTNTTPELKKSTATTTLNNTEETTLNKKIDSLPTGTTLPIEIDSTPAGTDSEKVEQTTALYKALPFSVYTNDNDVLVTCNSYALIYKDRSKVKIPYGCINYGIEIKKILSNNDQASLTITGYSSKEEDPSIGKLRADYLKKLLLGIGINDSQINTNASFQNIDFVNGVANGGILMRINNSNIAPIATSPAVVKENAVATTPQHTGPYAYKKFTGGYQGDYFYGNQTFTSYVSQIKNYLQDNPNKKVEIYTYTDSVGNAIDNMSIAKSNSVTAQRIVAQSGIPAYKIKSISMGEKAVDASGSSKCVILKVK